jgi:hypothetical protein
MGSPPDARFCEINGHARIKISKTDLTEAAI